MSVGAGPRPGFVARARKAVVTGVGMLVTVAVLVPQDAVPERLRPWLAGLFAVATVLGVYKVKNAQDPRHVAPDENEDPPSRGGY